MARYGTVEDIPTLEQGIGNIDDARGNGYRIGHDLACCLSVCIIWGKGNIGNARWNAVPLLIITGWVIVSLCVWLWLTLR